MSFNIQLTKISKISRIINTSFKNMGGVVFKTGEIRKRCPLLIYILYKYYKVIEINVDTGVDEFASFFAFLEKSPTYMTVIPVDKKLSTGNEI